MALGLNREGNILTKNDLPIRVERQGYTMPLEFIDLNSPPVVAVNCDNGKFFGKNDTERGLKKTAKNNNIELGKKQW